MNQNITYAQRGKRLLALAAVLIVLSFFAFAVKDELSYDDAKLAKVFGLSTFVIGGFNVIEGAIYVFVIGDKVIGAADTCVACSHCGKSISNSDQHCPHCGSKQITSADISATSTEAGKSTTCESNSLDADTATSPSTAAGVKCVFCGTPIPDSVSYCPNCNRRKN